MRREYLKELLFPPRCVVCDQLLPIDPQRATPDLCKECKDAWEREVVRQCPDCFMAYSRCHCMPKGMQTAGVQSYVKLVPYGEGGEYRATRRLISTIKERGRKRGFRFLAGELAAEVKATLFVLDKPYREEGAQPPRTVVSFLPRSRRALIRMGFDQAAELAKALAAEMGVSYLPLLRRARDGEPQKELDAAARRLNIKGAFALRGDPKGLRVLLVDDLVTSGAGMAEGAKLLSDGGAAAVLAVTVAQTERKNGNRTK
jgi:predicted amidophosphoribosyltransferase